MSCREDMPVPYDREGKAWETPRAFPPCCFSPSDDGKLESSSRTTVMEQKMKAMEEENRKLRLQVKTLTAACRVMAKAWSTK